MKRDFEWGGNCASHRIESCSIILPIEPRKKRTERRWVEVGLVYIRQLFCWFQFHWLFDLRVIQLKRNEVEQCSEKKGN